MSDSASEKRVNDTEKRLAELSVFETEPVTDIRFYKTREFARPEELPLDEFSRCAVGFTWERNRDTTPEDRLGVDIDVTDGSELPNELALGENVWFRLQVEIPQSMEGRSVSLRFIAEPLREPNKRWGNPRVECLCYRNGDPVQAFDDGHEDLLLTEAASGGETFEFFVEAGTTTLWGNLDITEFILDTAELYATREPVARLSRNYSLLNDLRKDIPETSSNVDTILRSLVDASHTFSFDAETESEYDRTAAEALDDLDALKDDLTSDLTGYNVTAVGHAHIDLAWLWPWSETVRKGARSFSNVLKLFDEYPEFTFLQSQPHLYEFVRHRYPDLYERIVDAIDRGQWRPVGALWVESDINIVGGEALARQFLYGKRYFREEFDVDPQIVFIPDVFGYSASLPGIARAADCSYFFTQKMSWNEVNDFPYSSFTWEGIDGSSLLAHFPPVDTYNGSMTVEEVRKSATDYAENDVVDESAYLVGWGDGGGGPTRDMLENRDVINDIGSLPDVEFDSLDGFFDRLEASEEELPTWVGELYLEKHRGTLTTQAATKRNNRTGEFELREAELWSSLAHVSNGEFDYPRDPLETAWKTLLFNQFHDILPGSSVTDVYADADRDYQQVFDTTDTVIDSALETMTDGQSTSDTVCVTNSLSWTRSPVVEISADKVASDFEGDSIVVEDDGARLPVQRSHDEAGGVCYLLEVNDVPPLGMKSVTLERGEADSGSQSLVATDSRLENSKLRIDFADDGTLSVYDKAADRDLFDDRANRLVRYRDHPEEFEAWDIENDLYDVGEDLPEPVQTTVVESGPIRATVEQIREFGDSRIQQEISIERDSNQIDFRTTVDWHEDETFLKAHFPIAVHANSATYDIQFGHCERPTHDNTSWDRARFEEPHQQWVDVSEYGYGVSVLNDSKYGVNVAGTDIGLSLLRAPNDPDPEADRGHHQFTYAIVPHTGDFREAGIIEAGYELNAPAKTVPGETSLDYSPINVETPGIIIEAVKLAEDSTDQLIVRLYEARGRQTTGTINFDLPVTAAHDSTLIEDQKNELPLTTDAGLTLEFDPFEIRTIIVDLER